MNKSSTCGIPVSAALLLPVILVSGCVTIANFKALSSSNPPTHPPRILPAQVALINGYDLDREAWLATGLFKSVQYSSSRVPPSEGVFILDECGEARSLGQPLTAGNALLNFLSVGLIPDVEWFRTDCTSSFFQNGQKLAVAKYSYTFDKVIGWMALAYNRETVQERRSQLATNAALIELAK